MGCSVSCLTFESLSRALQWILISKLKVTHMSHILDDFIFFGPPASSACQRQLDTFLCLSNSLNIPVKHQKTVLPATKVVLHGILVDTKSMVISLPEDKLLDARAKVSQSKRLKKISLANLQSLLGTLSFACRVVVPGRAFLRRLYDLTKGARLPSHFIRLTREARLDMCAWELFLISFNGRALCLPKAWLTSSTLQLHSDASGRACAAVFGSMWFSVEFPDIWESHNIAIKEFLPIVLAVRLWGLKFRDKKVIFFSDNSAVVSIINKQSSTDTSLMVLLRSLVVTSLQFNIVFVAKHIPGKFNTIADLLSRLQVSRAHQVAPWLDKIPQKVQRDWLPW